MQLDMSPSGAAVRAAPSEVRQAVAVEVEAQFAPYSGGSGLAVPAQAVVARASA